MKIRTGFVSNSSSSSFLIISTVEGHELTLKALGEKRQHAAIALAMSAYTGLHKTKVLGVDAFVFDYVSGNDGYELQDMFDLKVLREAMDAEGLGPDDELGDFGYELIQDYMDEVQKHKDTYYHQDHF